MLKMWKHNKKLMNAGECLSLNAFRSLGDAMHLGTIQQCESVPIVHLMCVYLDNNVLIDIEENVYSLNDFLSITEAEYYYSNAHISELLNGEDRSIPGLKDKRLSTIKAVCGENFLFQYSPSVIRLARCTP